MRRDLNRKLNFLRVPEMSANPSDETRSGPLLLFDCGLKPIHPMNADLNVTKAEISNKAENRIRICQHQAKLLKKIFENNSNSG